MNTLSICPQCQHSSNLYYQTIDRNRRISDVVFNYYRCPSCKLIFLSPIPEDLGRYYLSDYYQVPTSLEDLLRRNLGQHERIEFVKQFVESGRLLEIGPSYGLFAYFAKQAGYEVDTIEMSEECCQFLENTIGVRAIQSDAPHETLETLDTYDVIVMWQVIEHLSEPWKTIETAEKHLSDGGILLIATPNPDSFQFRIFKRYWHHTDAPRHLSLISPKLLNKHAQEIGLKPVMFTTRYSENIMFHNKNGWRITLKNVASNRIVRKLLWLIGTVLAKLFSPIDQRQGYGSTYVAIYQKDTNI